MTKYLSMFFVIALFAFTSCGPTDPEPENDEETITDVVLNFQDEDGVVFSTKASDPDGDGPGDIEFDSTLVLKTGKSYQLNIELTNGIANEDITIEVQEEAGEHQLFFEWAEGLFSDPSGTGNISDAAGTVNYLDKDENDFPLGLETQWTTGATAGTDYDFQVILKHQPGIKTAETGAQDGETDLNLTFKISLED